MDMGDARYDLLHYGKINQNTLNHLTESWYPSDTRWRMAALNSVSTLFEYLIDGMRTKAIK